MQLETVQPVYKWECGEGLPQADTLIALVPLYGTSDIELLIEESDELSSSLFFDGNDYKLSMVSVK